MEHRYRCDDYEVRVLGYRCDDYEDVPADYRCDHPGCERCWSSLETPEEGWGEQSGCYRKSARRPVPKPATWRQRLWRWLRYAWELVTH